MSVISTFGIIGATLVLAQVPGLLPTVALGAVYVASSAVYWVAVGGYHGTAFVLRQAAGNTAPHPMLPDVPGAPDDDVDGA